MVCCNAPESPTRPPLSTSLWHRSSVRCVITCVIVGHTHTRAHTHIRRHTKGDLSLILKYLHNEAQMDVNFYGYIYVAKAFFPLLKKSVTAPGEHLSFYCSGGCQISFSFVVQRCAPWPHLLRVVRPAAGPRCAVHHVLSRRQMGRRGSDSRRERKSVVCLFVVWLLTCVVLCRVAHGDANAQTAHRLLHSVARYVFIIS